MDFTIKQLRAFVYVANAGSFTEASKKLHVSQSALSLLVRELENELSVRLLDRSTRQTKLSSAGADFYPYAVKILQDLNTAVASTIDLQEKRRGRVRLACTPLYGASFIPEAVSAFSRRYPGVQINLVDALNEQVLQAVANGEVDLGIAPQRATPPELVQKPLFDDPIILVVPRDHALAAARSVSWKTALQHPFVTLTPDFTARLQADLHSYSRSLELRPVQSVAYLTTALGMIKCGYGVTALPSCAVPMLEPFGLCARKLDKPLVYRQVSVFLKKGQSQSPAAESLGQFLGDFAKEWKSAPAARPGGSR